MSMILPAILRALLLVTLALALGAEAEERQPPATKPAVPGRARRVHPIVEALDKDQNQALSLEEVAGAREALLSLDHNEDGNLTSEELDREGREAGGESRPASPDAARNRAVLFRYTPLLRVLDRDGDAELFEDEVSEASSSLLKLDQNGDGRLAPSEIMARPRSASSSGPPRLSRNPQDPPLQPSELAPGEGAEAIPDRATFARLSYQGEEVLRDLNLAGLEFVKFQIVGACTPKARIYFMNTKRYRAHLYFMRAVGITMAEPGQMRGVLIYRPMLRSPAGGPGHYTFEFRSVDSFPFEHVQVAYDLLGEHSQLLKGNLSYHLQGLGKERYLEERERYEEAGLPILEHDDLYKDIVYLPLHLAEAYGRLRLLKPGERPGPQEVVLCPVLPNEMPRVAGIISAEWQTPLSHVNLRALQSDVPNAFIAGAAEDATVTDLLGEYVYYRVAAEGYVIRKATLKEVRAHLANRVPASVHVPLRDLAVKEILPFSEIGFEDASRVGVKAANLATLRKLGLRHDLTPDGFAVPFSYYDAFMRKNGFYGLAEAMLETPGFGSSAEVREEELKRFRKTLRKGRMPGWTMEGLGKVQRAFPEGTSLRCRSSTNNEDLPGFSGAGLYDSYTHHPDEGHLSKSIKQVFASLWTFRAFEERELFGVDHQAIAMGVVLHPRTAEEQANGVAVTRKVLYGAVEPLGQRFYVNAQIGEDLVTNPEAGSIPEELLLSPRNPRTDRVIQRSSRAKQGQAVLSAEHLLELRRSLRVIHERFRELYGATEEAAFAMEVEFKVTAEGRLFIKQARPWVE